MRRRCALFRDAGPRDPDGYRVVEAETVPAAAVWHHDPYTAHYRLSRRSARRVRQLLADGYHVERGTVLWAVPDTRVRVCPHCTDGEYLTGDHV